MAFKYPKLEPGEQVRIRNKITGMFVYKPKGSSYGWRWSPKPTIWDSFKGPGHIIGQFAHNSNVNGYTADDIVVEVVTLQVSRTIEVSEQIEKKREIQRLEEEDNLYHHPRSYRGVAFGMVYQLCDEKHFRSLLCEHGKGLRFRGVRCHHEDIPEISSRLLGVMGLHPPVLMHEK
jgi:hypothetical protein